jgi:hypothetical protein
MKIDLVIMERQGFRKRLLDSLKAAGFEPSPTAVAREFNLRVSAEPITIHAVRKWLLGEAIPTQFRLNILAQMLGVDAQWLRFGEGEDPQLKSQIERIAVSREILMILKDVRKLDSPSRTLLDTLIATMLKL